MFDLSHVSRAIFDRCRGDWRILLYSGLLRIIDKEGKLVSFIPNIMQVRVIEKVWEIEQSGRFVRCLIPKARQHGITTLLMAIIFVKIYLNDNLKAIVMAQNHQTVQEIFEKAQIYYENIEQVIKSNNRIVKNNTKEMLFSNKSKILVRSAESRQQRGITGQLLLCSEVAFYPDTKKLMTGLLQQIANKPGTMIYMESTGNGFGDYYCEMCMDSLAGLNDYVVIFLAWFENPEYSMPAESDFCALSDGKFGNEVYYRDTFELSNDQLQWRRYTIANKLKYDLDKFMQEYPADIMECFLASGSPVFNVKKLNLIELETRKVNYRCANIINNNIIPTNDGDLKIFKDYVSGWRNRYIVSVDTGGVWEGADYSVALVYDRVEKEVVAILRGHYHSFEFAEMSVVLCRLYGNALLAIEINKLSSETQDETSLLDRVINHINYSNLYRRFVEYDKITNNSTYKVGFHTNSKTKRHIVEKLIQAVNTYEVESDGSHDNPHHLRGDNFKFNDVELVKEMLTYVIAKSKTGRNTTYQAQEGCKDDRVMAMGIALVVDEEMGLPELDDIDRYTAGEWTGDSIY